MLNKRACGAMENWQGCLDNVRWHQDRQKRHSHQRSAPQLLLLHGTGPTTSYSVELCTFLELHEIKESGEKVVEYKSAPVCTVKQTPKSIHLEESKPLPLVSIDQRT